MAASAGQLSMFDPSGAALGGGGGGDGGGGGGGGGAIGSVVRRCRLNTSG